MLFGRASGAENVELYDLGPMLDKALDRKLSALGSRCSGIIKEMQRARDQFASACKDFEALSVEPDTEYSRMSNASSIKIQKGFYTNALMHSVEGWKVSYEGARNLYEGYSAVLESASAFASSVLKTNATFKKVMHAYPNHFGQFRTSFSFVERSIESLRGEIEKRKPEYAEYKRVLDSGAAIAAKKEELVELGSRINASAQALNRPPSESPDENEARITAQIAALRLEISVKDLKISEMTNRINALTLPLERPARKLDHILTRKRQLYAFVTDPISTLTDQSECKEFLSLVSELKKLLSQGSIDVKNPERISRIVDELLATDVHAIVSEISRATLGREELVQSIEPLRRELRRLQDARAAMGDASEQLESLKRRSEELKAGIQSQKTHVEGLFLEYYGRRISIVV